MWRVVPPQNKTEKYTVECADGSFIAVFSTREECEYVVGLHNDAPFPKGEKKRGTKIKGIAVKIENESEYNQARGILDALGCFPEPSPKWSDWRMKMASEDFHVLTYRDGSYIIANHSGVNRETFYTFQDFIDTFEQFTKTHA